MRNTAVAVKEHQGMEMQMCCCCCLNENKTALFLAHPDQ